MNKFDNYCSCKDPSYRCPGSVETMRCDHCGNPPKSLYAYLGHIFSDDDFEDANWGLGVWLLTITLLSLVAGGILCLIDFILLY